MPHPEHVPWVRFAIGSPGCAAKRGVLVSALLLVVVVFSSLVPESADAAILLTESSPSIWVCPQSAVLEDPDRSLSIEQVASPAFGGRFEPVTEQQLNRGFSSSAFWLRFTIRSRSARYVERLLVAQWSFLRTVLYYRDASGTWQEQRGGMEQGHALHTRHSVFNLRIDARPRTFYLRVESDTAVFVPLRLVRANQHAIEARRRAALIGGYIAATISVALISLFLAFSLGQRSFIWFGWYASFTGLYFLLVSGLSYDFFELPTGIYYRALLCSLALSIIGGLSFARSFLSTRQFPAGDRVLVTGNAVALVVCMLMFLLPIRASNYLVSLTGAATIPIIVIFGLYRWLGGFKPARFFLLGWVVFFGTGLIHAALFWGVIPLTDFTANAYQVGTVGQILFLSVALADRVMTLQRERELFRHHSHHLMKLASIDELTQLYNRRHFSQQLDEAIAHASQSDEPLALVVLDIDNFKRFNDDYGHAEGDRVLVHLARLIQSSVRGQDTPCRYGGEEFVLILPNTTGEQARFVAENVRRGIRAEPLQVGREQVQVTISLGVAQYCGDESGKELFDRADASLLQAKRSGKDRHVFTAAS